MKKLLVSISLFFTMLVSKALAIMPKDYNPNYQVVEEMEPTSNWGIVICFIAIVFAILLIKIRMNKKK